MATHGDDHDHARTFVADEEDSLGHYAIVEMAVRELLIEKGVFSADEFRQELEVFDRAGPQLGARAVARAWTDPQFKESLLADGTATVKELGVDMKLTELYVVENTPQVHNVLVCTLCSCYP